MDPSPHAAFVRANTRLAPVPSVPEIRLFTADEAFVLWERTEEEQGRAVLSPPFWAFPWAGGLALARYVLDHPEVVQGRRVLDIASGSGLVAIAAAKAGAASVMASDIDPYAGAAIALNAQANRVRIDRTLGDVLDGDGEAAHVVLAGDVFYSRHTAERMLALFDRAGRRGARILVGDPGRAYLPRNGFRAIATYDVPVNRSLEDADTKASTVWERVPPSP
jgi:predicted nicotinamide N-methyase